MRISVSCPLSLPPTLSYMQADIYFLERDSCRQQKALSTNMYLLQREREGGPFSWDKNDKLCRVHSTISFGGGFKRPNGQVPYLKCNIKQWSGRVGEIIFHNTYMFLLQYCEIYLFEKCTGRFWCILLGHKKLELLLVTAPFFFQKGRSMGRVSW